MKKVKDIFLWIVAMPFILWRISRRRTYYISGTGISNVTGRRMWFKTTLVTYGNLLPLKSVEMSTAKELNFDRCVIVFFQRIPNSMEKYVTQEHELDIRRTENRPNSGK